MELQSLGKYRLVEPLHTHSDERKLYLVRHEDEPQVGHPSYIAKLLPPVRAPNGDTLRARFEHEVKLLEAFNHPCIPTLHAAGEQDGVLYMVLDRIDGLDLATLLGHREAAPRALSREIAVYIMGQLADALRHIHGIEYLEAGEPTGLDVLHRNICPANIVVSRSGDALLTGFGNARSRWLEPEYVDPMAGDPAYMAPERVTSTPTASPQTDLFAMAVVLWELLRGQRCLAGADDAATRDNITRFDISQASRRVSGLSPKLSEIVRKNLDRDPGRRYTGAYQLLQRLAQAPEAQSAEVSRAELGRLVAAATPVRQ